MLMTMRTVLLKLPSSARGLGPEAEPLARPFHAFSMEALRLACPFAIVRSPSLPFPPRGGRARAA
jgi:hypothetical protein